MKNAPSWLSDRDSSKVPLMASGNGPSSDMESFSAHLQSSKRVLALLGAGLSAASGLPTFRGAGGIWRNHQAQRLATPQAFEADPGLVWQFYNYRRHMALNAMPNPAHYALAELSKKKPGFITLSQNVDGTWVRIGLLSMSADLDRARAVCACRPPDGAAVRSARLAV